ncbi:MAG: V-type ATP synthase subunit F [Lachnospiraceae bacterium]|nr:V-type ATP synthase subunit F [Lachnospiraceae bacterium]
MDKICVVGDRDSIYGFAALGLSIFPTAGDHEEDAKLLRRLADGEYGIIYITESCAAALSDVIAEYAEKVFPAIIQIPGVSGNTGAGIQGVKQSVEKAVGSDILFGSDE